MLAQVARKIVVKMQEEGKSYATPIQGEVLETIIST